MLCSALLNCKRTAHCNIDDVISDIDVVCKQHTTEWLCGGGGGGGELSPPPPSQQQKSGK